MTNDITTTKYGFETGDEGDLICRHRDLSCCDACAAAHPEIIEVYGKHFWVADEETRTALAAMA